MSEVATSRLCLGPCGLVLDLGCFDRNHKGKYGRTARCRACRVEASRNVDKREMAKKAAEKGARDKMDAELGSKECVECGTRKSFSEYLPRENSRFGVQAKCRECKNSLYRAKCARAREKREKEKEARNRRDLDSETKECTKCGERKPFSAFCVSKVARLGLSQRCRSCKKEDRPSHQELKGKYLQRTYGITLNEYAAMLADQQGVCAICHKEETQRHSSGKVRDLSVDHDHTTGAVRGLLCNRCNTGIGFLQDDVDISTRAVAYLVEGNRLALQAPVEITDPQEPTRQRCSGPCGKELDLGLFGRSTNRKGTKSPRRMCLKCEATREREYDKEARAQRVAKRKARDLHDAKLGSKECTNCGARKHFSDFRAHKASIHGIQSQCKLCLQKKTCPDRARDKALQKTYNITLAEYTLILKRQGGSCAICRGPESVVTTDASRTKNLAVDHNHKTGAVRGLLCTRCNKGIGQLYDDEDIVRSAVEYLRKGQQRRERLSTTH